MDFWVNWDLVIKIILKLNEKLFLFHEKNSFCGTPLRGVYSKSLKGEGVQSSFFFNFFFSEMGRVGPLEEWEKKRKRKRKRKRRKRGEKERRKRMIIEIRKNLAFLSSGSKKKKGVKVGLHLINFCSFFFTLTFLHSPPFFFLPSFSSFSSMVYK